MIAEFSKGGKSKSRVLDGSNDGIHGRNIPATPHQNCVKSFLFDLVLDKSQSGENHDMDYLFHFPPPHGNGGNLANAFNASVDDGHPALESNILKQLCHNDFADIVVSLLINPGDAAINGNGILGRRTPGDSEGNVLGLLG